MEKKKKSLEEKEEYAFVLDFLPYGYPLEKRGMPIVQAVGDKKLTLLQIIPRRGVQIDLKEKLYIGEGKRDKVQFIQGRLLREKLTENAKSNLMDFVLDVVKENEEKYLKFFNEATSVNTRLHQIELLPGFGKKHTDAIIDSREEKPFESFEDLKERVHNLPDARNAIAKRIFEELTEMKRNNIFIK